MANRDPKFRWFRTYADIVDNSKLRLLAFEDRWHFVALCALKCDGLLENPDDPLLERKIALKLGVQLRELDEIKRRLMEVNLIDCRFHPVKWEMRQHRTPGLPYGECLSGYRGYIYFIGDPSSDTIKIGYSKNPWARVKDLQTGRTDKLAVVATVRTTDVSERRIHALFSEEHQAGEWFKVSPRIQRLITEIKAKRVCDDETLIDYVANYVATTKETETETETEEPPIIPPGGRRGKTLIPSDWKAPPISELPPRARACAEKWTRASYETEAEGFVLYWQSERKMKADWRGTWANRIIARHSAVMRDQKFGNAPPEPARQFTPDQEIATLERMIPLYQERGQNQHVERARQRIAELGRKRQTQSIGELAKSIAGRVA